MFKTLMRKQLYELLAPVLIDRKHNKKRTAGTAILFGALFLFCFVSIAAAFVGLSCLLADSLLEIENLKWLYFTLCAIMTLVLGIFGSIFATYSMLYQAKDNELLLSMPISSSMILLVRMIGVYTMGLLFAALVWIPAAVIYGIYVHPGFVPMLFAILMLFVFSLVILTLSCLLGWVVALVASRVKNKSIVVTVLTVVGVGGYYWLSFNLQELLQELLNRKDILALSIRENAWPLYEISQAAMGDIGAFLLCLAFALVPAALTWWILTKTFERIVTARQGGKKAVYRERKAVVRTADNALLRKEFRRFVTTPAYMLNCGLGCLMMPAAAVLLLVNGETVRNTMNGLATAWTTLPELMPLLLAMIMLFVISFNNVTAPSVSLEAKNLWILQSLPVEPVRVLDAKQKLSVILTLPAALLFAAAACIVLPMNTVGMILLLIFTVIAVFLNSVWGLTMNLRFPNLHWVNETTAVKSGAATMLGLFGYWMFAIVAGVAGYFAIRGMSPTVYFCIIIALMAVATVLLNAWVRKRGPEIIASL